MSELLTPHFFLIIQNIAKEYGVVLVTTESDISAFVNNKIIERVGMDEASAKSAKEWRRFFQKCAHKAIKNYWTSAQWKAAFEGAFISTGKEVAL